MTRGGIRIDNKICVSHIVFLGWYLLPVNHFVIDMYRPRNIKFTVHNTDTIESGKHWLGPLRSSIISKGTVVSVLLVSDCHAVS